MNATTEATGTTLTGRLITMIVFRIANRFLFRGDGGGGSSSSSYHTSGGAGDHNSSRSIFIADDAQRYLRSIGIAYSIPCVWKNWNVIADGVQKLIKRCRSSSSSSSNSPSVLTEAATNHSTQSNTQSTLTERTAPHNHTDRVTKSSATPPPPPPPTTAAAADAIPERVELTKLQTFLGILQQFDTWIQFLTLVLSGLMDIGSKHFVRLSVVTAICRQVCERICDRKRLIVMEKEKLLFEQRRLEELQKTIWGRIQLQIQKWIEQLREFFKWMLLLKSDAGESDEKQKQLTRVNTSSSTSSSSSSSSTSENKELKDHHRHRHHIQHAKRLLQGRRDSISDDLLVGAVQIMMVCVLASVEDNNNNNNTEDDDADHISWMSWFIQNILWILLTSKWKTVGLSWIAFLLTLIERDVLLNPDLTTKQKVRQVAWIAFVGGSSGKYIFSFGQ